MSANEKHKDSIFSRLFSNPGTLRWSLWCRLYNVNQGYNAGMLGKCETLSGYSVLVSKIWECRATMELEEAMKAAVRYCIENDILRLFLEANSSEVMSMLITEWNLEEAQRAWLAQGRDEGRNEGIEIGVGKGENNIVALLKSGKSPEDIIREFETKTVTAMPASEASPQA